MVQSGLIYFPSFQASYTFLIFPSSISVIQWLLNAETSHPTSSPPHRLTRFFTTLYAALRNPSRAVLQFYPNSDDQIHLITSIAQKAGFGGGVVVDYPNSKKARKVFLCLFVGSGSNQQIPKGLEGEETEGDTVSYERRREKEKRREKNGKRKSVKAKDWILKKKEVSCILYAPIKCEIINPPCSYTANEAKKVYLTTLNSRDGRGDQYSSAFFFFKLTFAVLLLLDYTIIIY